jgi:putative hydrolase of the HAD superfamily
MTYKAVFFDAGETLVYPHPSFPELLAEVLRELGHPVDPAIIRDRLHVVSDRFVQAARENELWSTSRERSTSFWRSIYGMLFTELGVPFGEPTFERLYEVFTDLSNYRLFPDVVPVLEQLQSGGRSLGVISNFEAWLEQLLEELDVVRFFDVRVISGAEGVEKPDPRIFQLAMERAGAVPEESAYVGDNVVFDVEPSRGLGMLAVLLDRRGRHPDHRGPRITSLEELPEVLGL